MLLFIFTQCNWYVQYQHGEDVLFENLPQIVQDSINSYNKVELSKKYKIDLICINCKYIYGVKFLSFPSVWVDYEFLINQKNDKQYKLYNSTYKPLIIYNDELYIPKEGRDDILYAGTKSIFKCYKLH